MFDSLRGKFQSVQEGISASFRGLSLSDSNRKLRGENPAIYNAGADILHKFQSQWCEMHKLSEENVNKAQDVDNVISEIQGKCAKQAASLEQLCICAGQVPKLLATVQELMEQLGSVEATSGLVESGLIDLEDFLETLDLRNRQLEHRFQMALYQQRRLAQLDSVRSQYVEKLKVLEENALRQRQEACERAFEEDVKRYKQSGIIPGSESKEKRDPKKLEKELSLEEVMLELEDPEALDAFLSEEPEAQNDND